MKVFADASGQHLNHSKCQLLLYGWLEAEPPPETIGGFEVVTRAKTLGIYFSEQHSSGEAMEAGVDWEKLLKAVSGSYDKLSRLPMSMFGHAQAAAGYGISKLLYHAEFAVMPEPVLQQLTRITAKLIDRGLAPAASVQQRRLPGIRSDLLMGPPSAGGVGMLPWQQHITARHAVWAGRLLEWLARMPLTRRSQLPANCPPWTLAAAEIVRQHNPCTHPALTFMLACLQPGSQQIRSAPLQRLAAGLAALGPPNTPSLQQFPVGPWCRYMPLWDNPMLRLEDPLNLRPPDCQQMVLAQAASHKAQLPPTTTAAGRGQHLDWDIEIEYSHENGWRHIRCLPQTRSIQQLLWLDRRLQCSLRADPTGQQLHKAVRDPEDEEAAQELEKAGKPTWTLEQREVVRSAKMLKLRVESLLQCVPRAWKEAPLKAEASMTTHAVTLFLRSLGWDAVAVTALPKALSTAEGRAAATAALTDKPEEWVPAAFQQQPRLQLFSSPLPLKVKIATRLQQGPWRAAVQDMHTRCIRGALQLDAMPGQQQQQQQVAAPLVQQLLRSLQPRIKKAWGLQWGNKFKETWWRLLLEGVPAAGGHGIALNGPCPCGWVAPAHLDAPSRAAAQRDHVFWHCPPATAVRRVLAHNLPAGVQLQAKHLWLLQPPCETLHPQVWMVVGLAALTVMASARKHMWALHINRRQQAPNQQAADPHVAATRRAVARLVDGVRDFVDLGRVPDAWVGKVQADHAFIGVRSVADPANSELRMHALVHNMNIPADMLMP